MHDTSKAEPTARPATAAIPAVDLGRGVVYDPPFVLAPMEGVTHRAFRDVILAHGGVGAAWTEFLRVSHHELPARLIRRELGPPSRTPPVGVQLMGNEPAFVAASARNAVRAGAPMVDLNFGCPAPVVFNKCAGSALLDFPERMEELVRAVVAAVDVPVTAKIRIGTTDATRLPDIVAAVQRAGAAALTVHARTRADGYTHAARWGELARVRSMTALPLIGNGDVLTADDALRMVATCGVDGVMVGRGVLRDPWIFAKLAARREGRAEPAVMPHDVLGFHVRYRDAMLADGAPPPATLSQLKQLWRRLGVGVALDDATRTALLRTPDLAAFDAAINALVAAQAG